jgi:hypothetical protein
MRVEKCSDLVVFWEIEDFNHVLSLHNVVKLRSDEATDVGTTNNKWSKCSTSSMSGLVSAAKFENTFPIFLTSQRPLELEFHSAYSTANSVFFC